MEALVSGEHGVTTLLAGLVIILSLHLCLKLGEFIFELIKKKSELTEKNIDNMVNALALNIEALHKLEARMSSIETTLKDFSRFKVDVRRLFIAIKELSGENWDAIRKTIMDDDFSS